MYHMYVLFINTLHYSISGSGGCVDCAHLIWHACENVSLARSCYPFARSVSMSANSFDIKFSPPCSIKVYRGSFAVEFEMKSSPMVFVAVSSYICGVVIRATGSTSVPI